MQEIYSEAVRKILQNKKKLERRLKVKITNKGKIIFVDGEGEKEYVAIEVIEAINLGFTITQALLLCEDDFILEKIRIKDLTKRHDLERVRGRIIGTRGRTKKTIQNLSDCLISLHDNTVGIIGRIEHIERAMQAITSLIQGSKQSSVYYSLEREKIKEKTSINEDLGLKR